MTVEELLDSLSTNYLAQDLYVEAWRLIHSAITAARAEGAEQERERIRQQGVSVAKGESIETPLTHLGYWDGHENLYADVSIVLIPSSVLSPAPKEGGELPR